MDVVEAIDAWIDEEIDDLTDDELETILEILDVVAASRFADLDSNAVFDDDIDEIVLLVGGDADNQAYTEQLLVDALYDDAEDDDPAHGEDDPDDADLVLADDGGDGSVDLDDEDDVEVHLDGETAEGTYEIGDDVDDVRLDEDAADDFPHDGAADPDDDGDLVLTDDDLDDDSSDTDLDDTDDDELIDRDEDAGPVDADTAELDNDDDALLLSDDAQSDDEDDDSDLQIGRAHV